MNRSQIDKILTQRGIPDPCGEPRLVETHISWVILGEERAFKIKKPVKFPFLDFSTLERRQYFCQRELQLNSRLTQGVYLKVLPIWQAEDRIWIGPPDEGEEIDSALVMLRLDTDKEMNRMLKAGKVQAFHVEQLADVIGHFHQLSGSIREGVDPGQMRGEFNALQNLIPFATAQGHSELGQIITKSIEGSDLFLQAHKQRIRERILGGFVRDCHGDLHSGNIFLYEPPVIFDCIEFNEEFRQIDVLSEVAFLAMDLEFHGRADLADHFLQAYLKKFPAVVLPEDELLFQYFKLYRANVRAKVHLLEARQLEDDGGIAEQMGLAARYGQLMEQYLEKLDCVLSQS